MSRKQIIRSPKKMQAAADELRAAGKVIGFVPTMGYLHAGHLSLVKRSVKDCDITVVSVFVNPTQFAPGEDFSEYPRDFRRDRDLVFSAGADIIFHPSAESMYPAGTRTFVEVEGLSGILEGKIRPTHFKGVATVVAKLLNMVKPHRAYFGRKDGQQAAIIKRMTWDLGFDTRIVVCPTIRTSRGVALSSRHVYLSPEQMKAAEVIYETLKSTAQAIKKGEKSIARLKRTATRKLHKPPDITLDYFEFHRWSSGARPAVDDLEPLKELSGKVFISTAVRIGGTRLIDNIVVQVPT